MPEPRIVRCCNLEAVGNPEQQVSCIPIETGGSARVGSTRGPVAEVDDGISTLDRLANRHSYAPRHCDRTAFRRLADVENAIDFGTIVATGKAGNCRYLRRCVGTDVLNPQHLAQAVRSDISQRRWDIEIVVGLVRPITAYWRLSLAMRSGRSGQAKPNKHQRQGHDHGSPPSWRPF